KSSAHTRMAASRAGAAAVVAAGALVAGGVVVAPGVVVAAAPGTWACVTVLFGASVPVVFCAPAVVGASATATSATSVIPLIGRSSRVKFFAGRLQRRCRRGLIRLARWSAETEARQPLSMVLAAQAVRF